MFILVKNACAFLEREFLGFIRIDARNGKKKNTNCLFS